MAIVDMVDLNIGRQLAKTAAAAQRPMDLAAPTFVGRKAVRLEFPAGSSPRRFDVIPAYQVGPRSGYPSFDDAWQAADEVSRKTGSGSLFFMSGDRYTPLPTNSSMMVKNADGSLTSADGYRVYEAGQQVVAAMDGGGNPLNFLGAKNFWNK